MDALVMQCFHWNRQADNYAFLEGRDQCLHGWLGPLQVPGLSGGESVTYQTCLIFLRPLPTLMSDPNFSPLATGLSVTLPGLSVILPGLSLSLAGLS